jgi:hypothetical protein
MPNNDQGSQLCYCYVMAKDGMTCGVAYSWSAVELSKRFVLENLGGKPARAISVAPWL